MGRSLKEIQQPMIDAKNNASQLSALDILTTSEITLTSATSTSKVAIWRLFFYIFAIAIRIHEDIVEANAKNSRPQSIPNFNSMVLNFHDGLPLVWQNNQFQYNLTGVSNPDDLKVVGRCAVIEGNGLIVVKVTGKDFEPLTDPQVTRLESYLKSMKPPGPMLRIVNKPADQIKATLKVYVDPQMIDLVTGKQLNVSEEIFPVKDAINEYLTSITKAELNGAFVTNFFKRTIEDKDGVFLVEDELMQWSFESAPFTDFTGWKVPESGHFKIEAANLTITHLPYVLVNN